MSPALEDALRNLDMSTAGSKLPDIAEAPEDINISIRDLEGQHDVSTTLPEQPELLEGYYPMRVMLVQTAAGLKPPSGGYRGNYAMLNALASHGHTVAQLCWAYHKDVNAAIAEVKAAGQELNWKFERIGLAVSGSKTVSVKHWKFTNVHGIHCIALDAETMVQNIPNEVQMAGAADYIKTGQAPAQISAYSQYMAHHIKEFKPTHVIFNDALTSKITSDLYAEDNSVCRVEITHTMEQLPLGPFAGGIPGSSATDAEADLWAELDGVIAVSGAVQAYAKEHNGLDAVMIPNHPWVYKDKDTNYWPRRRNNFAKQRVAMINPAHVKGYSVFLEMAKKNKLNQHPYDFVVYQGWGTTEAMVQELVAQGVRVFSSERDMEPVYDNITVLVMPSLWQEAWGVVATEAQLRGIVVLSSDVGGIREAKRWCEPTIQVKAIDGAARDSDGTYVIPKQDVQPWFDELENLLEDKEYYVARADAAYYATRAWVQKFDIREHEKYLLGLKK